MPNRSRRLYTGITSDLDIGEMSGHLGSRAGYDFFPNSRCTFYLISVSTREHKGKSGRQARKADDPGKVGQHGPGRDSAENASYHAGWITNPKTFLFVANISELHAPC